MYVTTYSPRNRYDKPFELSGFSRFRAVLATWIIRSANRHYENGMPFLYLLKMKSDEGKIGSRPRILMLERRPSHVKEKTYSMSSVLTPLLRLKGFCLDVLHPCFVRWTKPLTTSLPLGTLTDLGRSKSQLIAENALLRQQLIMLSRQVKHPACSKADRTLLILLARLVRTWKQALFIVQPDTLLRWHRELFRLYWKRRSKASSHRPRVVYRIIEP
jgi:hypothetical protein